MTFISLINKILNENEYIKNTLKIEDKNYRIQSDIWNEFSYLVCEKCYKDLSKFEIDILERYTYDYLYPEWVPFILNGENTGYMINNIGDVRGKRGDILKKDIVEGYYKISGYFNGKPMKISIHRAVAIAFILNPENKPQVNHINGNKLFNWVGNLEWNTAKENTDHAVNTGLMNFKCYNHPENIYALDQIKQACELLENPKLSNVEISKITGINRSIIYSIRNGKSWKDISSQYNIYRPPINHNKYKMNYKRNAMNPKTKFILDSINSGMSKDELSLILMESYGFTSSKLAKRSINKVLLRYKNARE